MPEKEPLLNYETVKSLLGFVVAILLILGFVLCMPVIWQRLLPTTVHTLGLAGLGSIMGSIFTLGGLVVAAFSVFSLVTVRGEIIRGIQESKEKSLEQFNKEMDNALTAYDSYIRARDCADPKQAEPLIQEALDVYGIKNARYFLGSKYHEHALERFKESREKIEIRFSIGPVKSREEIQNEYNELAVKAIQWLQEALKLQDGPRATVHLMLAEAYGIVGSKWSMFKHARASVSESLNCRPDIVCLANACNGSENDLQELGKIFDITIPWDLATLTDKLKEFLEAPLQYPPWDYFTALVNPLGWEKDVADYPLSPGIVHIHREKAGELVAKWRTISRKDQSLPKLNEDGHYSEPGYSPEKMAQELIKRFWFIEGEPSWSRPVHIKQGD